jgi:hypothetical protein
MLGSEVIDVGIGMALLFLFMSLIATALREIIENFMKTRSTDLERGLTELLSQGDKASTLVNDFYKHPVIFALYKGNYEKGGKNLPSYIPRQSFSLALLDVLTKASETGSLLTVDSLRAALGKNPAPNAVQRVVLLALGTGERSLDDVRKAIEDWYDGTMDRVSGWYTRRTGRILALIGFGAAVFFNIDAITVAQHLIRDKALRQTVISEAAAVTKESSTGASIAPAGANPPAPLGDFSKWVDQLNSIGFPMGWQVQGQFLYPKPQACDVKGSEPDGSPTCYLGLGWIIALCGWGITALAIMLGAPFWFDVLNKFMVIRSTIKPKEKSPDEASADARAAPPTEGAAPTAQAI